MEKSTTPIINHIPRFLSYCKKRSYSHNTQENYKRYLQKFILWLRLKNNKKHDLKPHELDIDDVAAYKVYLSDSRYHNGRFLKDTTQNYYLIALRALLGYFVAENIDSLLPAKIALSRLNKSGKTTELPNLDQTRQLLSTPDTKTRAGLRDRAILETIISTGLKINQIVNLNKNKLDEIPGTALTWVKKYLQTRNDGNEALFINYKTSKKESLGERLTPRSIERIIKHCGEKIKYPFLITPETLRWARPRAIFNEIIKIKVPHIHQIIAMQEYDYRLGNKHGYPLNQSPTWDAIESLIKNEIIWLKNNIPVMPERFKTNPPFLKCDDCIFRKIAILIISGKVNAKELLASGGQNLWNNLMGESSITKMSHHGQGWHKKIMDIIYDYFRAKDHEVIMEPALNYGRADLGIHLNGGRNIYVEVDTVSLFKLWYNLSVMKNTTFLIIPSEDKIIEFNIL